MKQSAKTLSFSRFGLGPLKALPDWISWDRAGKGRDESERETEMDDREKKWEERGRRGEEKLVPKYWVGHGSFVIH